MKRIGFIDYYLDEWHANNYPAWIKEACAAGNLDFTLAYAYAEKDKEGGLTTDGWCDKFGATRCASCGELVEKSDCIVVLAPDNPERHEELSSAALSSGKPVYVDKTFADSLPAAKRMFELARKHGTPMYSSSALRFAEELDPYRAGAPRPTTAIAAGGYDFATHGIHTLEMLVTAMGGGAQSVRAELTGRNKVLMIDYGGGRQAVAVQAENGAIPYQMCFEAGGESRYSLFQSDFFRSFISAMLDFFVTGKPAVSERETLEVMALIDAAKAALARPGKRVKIG